MIRHVLFAYHDGESGTDHIAQPLLRLNILDCKAIYVYIGTCDVISCRAPPAMLSVDVLASETVDTGSHSLASCTLSTRPADSFFNGETGFQSQLPCRYA